MKVLRGRDCSGSGGYIFIFEIQTFGPERFFRIGAVHIRAGRRVTKPLEAYGFQKHS